MQVIWNPDLHTIEGSNIYAAQQRLSLDSYDAYYRWSIENPAAFWTDVVDRLGICFKRSPSSILDLGSGPTDPTWLSDAQLNIAESCFQADAEACAMVSGEDGKLSRTSYAELRSLANQVACGLRRLGLQLGDAVAVFMPMTARSIPIYLGTVLAGGVVVSIADSFVGGELKTRLRIGAAKWVFTEVASMWNGKPLGLYERIVAVDGPKVIVADDRAADGVRLRSGDILWRDFIGSPDFDEVAYVDPAAAINLLFSSGTTGDPKAIPWDHTTPIKAASDGHFHQDIHTGDVVAWPTNLGWMMGPWLIFATLINRATIALFEGAPWGKPFGDFVENAGVTMLGVVPSMVLKWRQLGCMETCDWSAIRVFSSTGECSNPQDMRYLSQLAGGKPIIEYCGGTELGGGYITSSVVQPNIPSAFSTCTLGTRLVILDEKGNPAKSGEAFLVPPTIGFSRRLLNKSHHEVYYENVPVGPQGEVLRRHGDQLETLPNGYLRAVGRTDDTMNLGGVKVGAAEIERVVARVPGIQEVAAICVTPPIGGSSQLIVYVGMAGSAKTDAPQLHTAMQHEIKTQLNPLFRIHDVLVLEKLPRTASNKIMRRELRAQYERLGR